MRQMAEVAEGAEQTANDVIRAVAQPIIATNINCPIAERERREGIYISRKAFRWYAGFATALLLASLVVVALALLT